MTDEEAETDDLLAELAALRRELGRLNNHRFLKINSSIWRMMWFNLLRGVALGLGTVIGATIVVSIAAYFLAQIDFIPIIGTWASEIAKAIQPDQTP
ncbi:MAG: DUF5665 domain-containing protein [Paracoccaceae bacterium]